MSAQQENSSGRRQRCVGLGSGFLSGPTQPRLLANRTDFAISRPAVGKVRWRRNSFAGFTCALLIWTLPFRQGLTAQAQGLR